jgi:hypothetical protein
MLDVMLLIALRGCSAWCYVPCWYFVILALLALVVGKHPCSRFHCVGSRVCFIPSTPLDVVAVGVADFAS